MTIALLNVKKTAQIKKIDFAKERRRIVAGGRIATRIFGISLILEMKKTITEKTKDTVKAAAKKIPHTAQKSKVRN